MLQVIKYYMTWGYGISTVLVINTVIILMSGMMSSDFPTAGSGFAISLSVAYTAMFSLSKKNKIEHSKHDFPISTLKLNLIKFISLYIYMMLAAMLHLTIHIINGYEALPTAVNLIKYLSISYFVTSLIGRASNLKEWEKVVNFQNIIYLIFAFLCMYIISIDRPDVLQMRGIPSNGIYGLLLYFSILILLTTADFFAIHFNSNKLSLVKYF